jgi:hypothetical protein
MRLFAGKAEKGSHSEHLVQRLCVGSGIIWLNGLGFLIWGPSIRVSVSLAHSWLAGHRRVDHDG